MPKPAQGKMTRAEWVKLPVPHAQAVFGCGVLTCPQCGATVDPAAEDLSRTRWTWNGSSWVHRCEPHALGCGCLACQKRLVESQGEPQVFNVDAWLQKLAALDAKLDRLGQFMAALVAMRVTTCGPKMFPPGTSHPPDGECELLWANYVQHGPRQEASDAR